MTPNPYLITGPALISFSGGRTSAYMLHQIIQAHGGTLPPDVVVAFANTGKEREETLRFVHECGSRWGVHVHWVEWRPMPKRFEEVGFNSAARAGEPFEGLIALRGRLPNPLQRFCSRELKVEPIKALCRSMGWDRWSNVIGLRHDEGHRVLRKLAENEKGGHRWKSAMPLADAGTTKADVLAFWAGQGFDLGLRGHEGNCDLCFLKSEGKLRAIIRDNPGVEAWWIAQEAGGKRFERDRSFESVARQTHAQPLLALDDDDHDAECGLTCGGESPLEKRVLQAEYERTRKDAA
jgi:3'-phosphoadenosine 5'-phosphosulfate sulfotransferase (PAPS reductase)/FAD synthetase